MLHLLYVYSPYIKYCVSEQPMNRKHSLIWGLKGAGEASNGGVVTSTSLATCIILVKVA